MKKSLNNKLRPFIHRCLLISLILFISNCSLAFQAIGQEMGKESDAYVLKNRNKCSFSKNELISGTPIYENIQMNGGLKLGLFFDFLASILILFSPPQNTIKYLFGGIYLYFTGLGLAVKSANELNPPPILPDGWLYRENAECDSHSLVLFKIQRLTKKVDKYASCKVFEDNKYYFNSTFLKLNNLEKKHLSKLNSFFDQVYIHQSETNDFCNTLYIFAYKGGLVQLKKDLNK